MKKLMAVLLLLVPCRLFATDWEIKQGTSYCVEREGYIADCFDSLAKAQEMVDIMNEVPQQPKEPTVDVTPPVKDSNEQGTDHQHCYDVNNQETPCE